MYRWLVSRCWLGLLAAVLSWTAGAASARAPVQLDPARPVDLAAAGDFWLDAEGRSSLETFTALRAEALQPTRAGALHRLRPGQVLWLRFTLPAGGQGHRWFLKLPDPALDKVTLYTRAERGWTQQVAGDHVAISQWPLPHLYPVFALAVDAGQPSHYVLRIEGSQALSAPVLLESEACLTLEQQRIALAQGVYFGLLAMVAIFGLVTALVFRDGAYVWFGLYAVVTTVSAAAFTGAAGLHLWPHWPVWNDAAKFTLPTLSLAPLLAFIASTTSLRARSNWLYWLFMTLAASALLAAVSMLWLAPALRLPLSVAAVLGLSAFATAGCGWAWRHGDRFARWLLLAFSPMLLALPFSAARWLEWAPQQFMTQYALQLALALSLPALFLLLVLRSQERSDYRRRITQLDQLDPLTGLVNDDVFAHRLRALIERSQRFDCQGAVVLVDFTNLHALREEFGRRPVLEVLLRLAGRLTSMVRDVDTVARVGEARYGLLIEGPVPVERASQVGSKVLARLIMPFPGMPVGLSVRPKVAVALVPAQGTTVAQVLERLDAMLKEAPPDNRRNVYVVDDTMPAPLSETPEDALAA